MKQRLHIDNAWIDANGYRDAFGNPYRYELSLNGRSLASYARRADAIAEARYAIKRGGVVYDYGTEREREEPLTEVEVDWIGSPDTHAVWFWTRPAVNA